MNTRDNNFSSLRFAGACMVIAGHMCNLLATVPPVLFGRVIHAVGVDVLFLVGGYLIAQSWLSDPHALRYSVKRVARIWPPLAVFVLVAAFAAGPLLTRLPLGEYFTHPMTARYLENLWFHTQFALPGVLENNIVPNTINGSLWTLPLEMLMYLVVPLLLSLFRVKKKSEAKIPWAGIFVVTAAVCGLEIWKNAVMPGAVFVWADINWSAALDILPFYFIGMLYGAPGVRKYLNLPLASVILLLACCFQLGSANNSLMMYTIFPYFVFSLAFAPASSLSRLLDKYEISYGLYLYGFFVQQLLVHFTMRDGIVPFRPSVYVVLAVVCTGAVALLSARFIEKPCLRLSKKILQKLS